MSMVLDPEGPAALRHVDVSRIDGIALRPPKGFALETEDDRVIALETAVIHGNLEVAAWSALGQREYALVSDFVELNFGGDVTHLLCVASDGTALVAVLDLRR